MTAVIKNAQPRNGGVGKRIYLFQDFIWFLIPLIPAGLLLLAHFFIFSQTLSIKGIELLKDRRPRAAEKLFLKILEKEPFHPYARLNLGLCYDRGDRPLKALKEYELVLNFFDREFLQFFSAFNRGELNGRLGRLSEALENYQTALSFSIEQKKIKQNIELLFQDPSGQQGDGKGQKGSGKALKKDPALSADEGDSPSSEDSSSSKERDPGDKKTETDPSGQPDGKTGAQERDGESEEGGLSKRQAQSIMDEMERRSADIRARRFQNSSRRSGNKNLKDW